MILDKARLPISAGVFCLAAVFSGKAGAAQVYPGCAVPPATFNHIWYVDPVNGKTAAAGGLGTQGAPWNSLQAAFSVEPGYTAPLLSTAPYHHPNPANPANTFSPGGGPIQPGDEILLMSGDYGQILIGLWHYGVNNPSFVIIAAAPGQTPLLSSLTVKASSGFMFSGIKVQSLATRQYESPMVSIGDQGPGFPTSNIILSNVSVSAADPSVTATWTQAEWAANTRVGISAFGSDNGANTTCVSVVGSHITANHFGVVATANQMLVSGNEIDHFGDDAVDYAASNLTITQNYIHDPMDWNIGAHMDGMQGYPGRPVAPATYVTFKDVVIDSNRIIRQTSPNQPFPTYLQAIDAFDGNWENLRVTNNAIVTSSCWGIGFGSVHGGQIINNTVVDDGSDVGTKNLAGRIMCRPGTTVGDRTHQGASSNDVVIRNNLTNGLSIYNLDPNMVMDHNICSAIDGKCAILIFNLDGKPRFGVNQPGVYGDHNIIERRGADAEFVKFDPANFVYDLRLKAGAPAIGAGSPLGAPPVDITGAARGNPIDIGAYRYDPDK
jgi:hypothetical protein